MSGYSSFQVEWTRDGNPHGTTVHAENPEDAVMRALRLIGDLPDENSKIYVAEVVHRKTFMMKGLMLEPKE